MSYTRPSYDYPEYGNPFCAIKHTNFLAGVIVFNERNEVLMIKQKNGFMGFPKGGVYGETLFNGALRELKEEADVEISSIIDHVACYSLFRDLPRDHPKFQDTLAVWFFAFSPTVLPIIADTAEIESAEWIKISNLRAIFSLMNHPSKKIATILLKTVIPSNKIQDMSKPFFSDSKLNRIANFFVPPTSTTRFP